METPIKIDDKVKYQTKEGRILKHTYKVVRIEGNNLITKSYPCRSEIIIPIYKAILIN